MANSSAMWQQATHATYHHFLAALQEPYKEVGGGVGGGIFKQNGDDKQIQLNINCNYNKSTLLHKNGLPQKKHYASHPLSRTQIKTTAHKWFASTTKKHYASHPLGRTLQVSLRWCNALHITLDPREVSVCRRWFVRPVQPWYVTRSTLDFAYTYSQQFPGNHWSWSHFNFQSAAKIWTYPTLLFHFHDLFFPFMSLSLENDMKTA